jgi:triosephosphate isomerase
MAKRVTRRKIVAGNWKMNKTQNDAVELASAIKAHSLPKDVTVVLCPPSVLIHTVGQIIGEHPTLKLGAQNCNQHNSGAYTGEISAAMLQSIGVQYVIIGHSERREYFKEDAPMLVKKIDMLLSKQLTPIYCCGEPLKIREKKSHVRYVAKQIQAELFHLSPEDIQKVVIAYEPIWAIGTGLTATPEQAQEMHKAIRNIIKKKYGKEVANTISILYGGSCNAANAATLFTQKDVDGGLIGGASLNADDFVTISKSFK